MTFNTKLITSVLILKNKIKNIYKKYATWTNVLNIYKL